MGRRLEHTKLICLCSVPAQDDSCDPFDVMDEMKWCVRQVPKGKGQEAFETLTLNGVKIMMSEESSINDMLRDYERAMAGCIIPDIGPWPKTNLSPFEMANDEVIRVANDTLVGKPSIRLMNNHSWNTRWRDATSNPFALACLATAERVARLAQLDMDGYVEHDSPPPTMAVLNRAAKKAGLPTIDYRKGSQMVGEIISLLYREWTYGGVLKGLTQDSDALFVLAAHIMPPKQAPSMTCTVGTPPPRRVFVRQ